MQAYATNFVDEIVKQDITGFYTMVRVFALHKTTIETMEIYVEKFAPEIAVRTSMADYRKEEWLLNLPLYAIGQLDKILLSL